MAFSRGKKMTFRCGLLILVLTWTVLGCGAPKEPASGGTDLEPASASKGAEQPDGPIRVAFIVNVPAEFWMIAKAGTEKASREFGCEVEFRVPPRGTAQEQQQIVEDLITRGVSGLAISANDPENQVEMLNAAAERVNVICQDSDAPQSNRLCYIGTDNHEAGMKAAKLIKEAVPDGGRIMLFVGTLDAQTAIDRKTGIEDGLAGGHIEIIDTRTDDKDQLKAIANVQDTLVKYPDVACLVGLWGYNGPAILNALRDSGKLGEVAIVCFDENDETLQGIKDGHIHGTIVQQPFEFGYRSVKLLVELARGDRSGIPPDKQIFIPSRSITTANVDAFWAELEELLDKA